MGLTNLAGGGVELFWNAIVPNGVNRWVALYTSRPDDYDDASGTEVTDTGYSRVLHTAWHVRHPNKRVENSGQILFPDFDNDVSGIVAWGVLDAATLGNLLMWGYLRLPDGRPSEFSFEAGAQVRFMDGDLWSSLVVC